LVTDVLKFEEEVLSVFGGRRAGEGLIVEQL
jgi:hypothetical protein